MAPSGGLWSSVGLAAVKNALKSQSKLLKARISEVTGRVVGVEVKPAFVVPRQAIHPLARFKQSHRWYTTHAINATVKRFLSTSTPKYDRSSFPKSKIRTAVNSLTSRAPFASTLRPNLTGGAFPRTAGGYSLGSGRIGGVRNFSHTPAAPAQVVHNVSNAFRAFALSGKKAQFDGTGRNGNRFRAVSKLQKETTTKLQSIPKTTPGSYLDFQINPTITALSPLGTAFPGRAAALESEELTINTEGFLDILSCDFARALQDLAAINNDLKRLSTLGNLSITMENKSTLRVHFPGCDAETVENLCNEIGIQRGIVHEDLEFDASIGGDIALMFPYAPTSDYPLSSPGGSLRSQDSQAFDDVIDSFENPWISSPEGFTTLDELSESGSEYFGKSIEDYNSDEYVAGINRFLEFCDTPRRV